MDKEDGLPFVKGGKPAAAWLRVLRRRLPLLAWAPRYGRAAAVADLVAGVTLGLTLVPQSIAYASLANLPVQYGLYSSFIGTMLYVALGTVKEVSIGPTSLMALITLQTCRGLPIEFVVLLAFLSGCVVLVMGLLRLGFLVDLISPSVTSGFTSATAVIIVVSQLKGILGLSFIAESVFDNVRFIAAKWALVRPSDCALGTACCLVLLALRKLKDIRVSPKHGKLKKALWLLSIGRNALVLLAASGAAYLLHEPDAPLFKLSGRVEPGLPPLSLPPVSAALGNGTVHFVDMVRRLGSGVLMVPVVMVLANIAIAKAFSTGGRVDATQEMLTLGLCNMAGSLFHAMPTCGAFTRSAVSHSSGVRTPAAGLYSGIVTLFALMFLTQHFYFIPKACLSSVLICSVVFMVDIPIVFRLWRQDRCELFVLVLTFAVSVTRTVELAVLAGALASLAVLLRALMRPPVHVHDGKSASGPVRVVRVCGGALYLNAELLARRLLAAAPAQPAQPAARAVLLDCAQLAALDYAAKQMFRRLIEKFKAIDQRLIFYNANPDVIHELELVDGIDARPLRAADVDEALALAAAPRRVDIVPRRVEAAPSSVEASARPAEASPRPAEASPRPAEASPRPAEAAPLLGAPAPSPADAEAEA